MHRIMDGLERGISGLVILALGAMVLLIGAQVGARYLLNQPLHWTEEVARHLMIWMFFLAAVVALRRGAHLSIDLVPERLRPAGRLVLRLGTVLLLAYFFYLMARYGWELTLRTMGQRSSALHYPMAYVYSALPASGALMFLFNVESAFRAVKLFRKEVQQSDAGGNRNIVSEVDAPGEGRIDR